MNIPDQIEKILVNEFNPGFLRVSNNSYQHAGHSGDDGSGNTHFLIEISANDIPEKFTHQKHKMVVDKLSDIFKLTHSIEIRLINS